ncbi:MAG: hypothetical protein ACK42E_04130 [Candidatus Bipolaricaulaceae bacterium]
MRTLAVFVVAAAGWAMELAHPVLFDCEPLVLWTQTEDPPVLYFCGRPWPVEWQKAREGERIRWEASLCAAPLGVWSVQSGLVSWAFLRVSSEESVLELVGAPPGAVVSLDGRTHTVGETGSSFFVVQPGVHALVVEHLCDRLEQELNLPLGQRTRIAVGNLEDLGRSSAQVLPGHKLALTLRVRSALSLPFLEVQVRLPFGWRVEIPEDMFSPVPAAHRSERSFLVEVPAEAEEGVYAVVVRWHGLVRVVEVEVAKDLSPLVVVGHWDVREGRLNLAAPFALTYERALWAASLLGRPIPYSTAIMTPELLQTILEKWASGEAG